MKNRKRKERTKFVVRGIVRLSFRCWKGSLQDVLVAANADKENMRVTRDFAVGSGYESKER